MDEVKVLLEEKAKKLQQMITKSEFTISKSPEGRLVVNKNRNIYQYYVRTDPKDTHGKYIRKQKQRHFIHQLAQKEYAIKVLTKAEEQLRIIEKFLSKYNDEAIKEIFDKLIPAKQCMITPYVLSDEQFVKEWDKTNSQVCSNEKEDKMKIKLENEEDGIYTEKGELVRSKSEKILADKLYMMGIPYCYERPLFLKEYGVVYPDFTVLNIRTRKEYFWEHLGRMDKEDYLVKTIRKIETYTNNDIFQGEKLILTYETKSHPLNSKIVDKLIRKYLL